MARFKKDPKVWEEIRGKDSAEKWETIKKLAGQQGVSESFLLLEFLKGRNDLFVRSASAVNMAGPSNQDLEDAIISNAVRFTIVTYRTGSQSKEQAKADTFADALIAAGNDKRALIYGIASTGQSAVLSRKNWEFYSFLIDVLNERAAA